MGLPFFNGLQSNMLNFIPELDAAWKLAYRSSEVLSWKHKKGKSAVNIIVIGRVGRANLESALTEYDNASYRLELLLDRDTMSALRFSSRFQASLRSRHWTVSTFLSLVVPPSFR
jgi:hypothetical protein